MTDRIFYGSKKTHYEALGRIFQITKERRGWREGSRKKIIALVVREARKVIRSQMIAGMSRNEQDAQEEFIDLNNQRAHSGISPIVDTQRYMDISTSFRQLCNYRIIKGFGAQPIPEEFEFLFKPRLFGTNPNLLRNMPPDEFIALTSWNGVCRGVCAKVHLGY